MNSNLLEPLGMDLLIKKQINCRCYFCGETKSVKYLMTINDPAISNTPAKVCCCNRCALLHNPNFK